MISISLKSYKHLLLMAPIAVFIIFFNSIIFQRHLLFIVIIFLVIQLLLTKNNIKKIRPYRRIWLYFIFFIVYISYRVVDPNIAAAYLIVEILAIFLIMYLSALNAYNNNFHSGFIWYFATSYWFMFLSRNLIDYETIQTGYSLNMGFVIIGLLPIIGIGADNPIKKKFFYIIGALSIVYLMYIGARSATISVLMFVILVVFFKYFNTKRKFLTLSLFVLLSIPVFYFLYMSFASLDKVAWLGESSFHFFDKRIGTRIDIWTHLIEYISFAPFFGAGADSSTELLTVLDYLEFSSSRTNIPAHSTYLEVIYRLGIVGMALFLFILISMVMILSNKLYLWEVRVVASYVLSISIYLTTVNFVIMDSNPYSAFVWLVFGVGVGVASKYENAKRCMAR